MKILIADDHSVVRKGLRLILEEEYPHSQIDEVPDAVELLKRVSKETYTVIISDITMPGRSGVEIIKEVKEHAPKTPLLVLSVHAAEEYAVRAIRAGASGYLTKDSAPDELIKAIEYILKGKRYITSEIAELLADSYGDNLDKPAHECLSNREFEVMKFIASGKSISEMAQTLSLSVNTISTYRARILDKMHINTNTELIKYAIEHKLV
ncbi:MAG TPA: response regulator transcription factor [Chitinophagaceae bacterium]|nr:response regulator transcription factor [Chitinophagaceae bacterium]